MRPATVTLRITLIPKLHSLYAPSRERSGGGWFVFNQQRKEQGAYSETKILFENGNLSAQKISENREVPPARTLDPFILKPGQERMTDRRHADIDGGDIETRIPHRHPVNSECR